MTPLLSYLSTYQPNNSLLESKTRDLNHVMKNSNSRVYEICYNMIRLL